MTVIRHNSISGIVSITAAAGSNLSFYDSAGATLSLDTGDINAGVITATTANFTNATVTGDLTVQGTTTTLDTTVTEVDKLEVGANNTTVGVAITQSGTGDILRLYDGASQVVTVKDGGSVGIGTDNPLSVLEVNGGIGVQNNQVNTSSVVKLFSPTHDTANRGAKIRFGLNDGSFGGIEVENVEGGNSSHNSQTVHLVTHNGGIAGDIKALTARYDGNVGIGSDSPDASLVVDSGITPTTIKITSNTESSIDFNDKGGTPKRYKIGTNISSNDGQFEIRDVTANAERLRITSEGRMGLGCTPETTADFQIRNSSSGNLKLGGSGTDATGFSINYNNNGNTITTVKQHYRATSGSAQLHIDTGTFTLATGTSNTERFRITSNGNVRIQADNTTSNFTVANITGTTYILDTTTPSAVGTGGRIVFGSTYYTGGNTMGTAYVGSYKENAPSNGGNEYDHSLVFGTQSSSTSGEKLRITSRGDIKVTQTPGRYTIDATGGATTIANSATVDFPSASGMLVVNNWTNGHVTIYLCGGGATTAVASVGSSVGSFTYNSGVAGYRWTNNYGSAAVFGFFFVRTRTTA